MTNKWVHNHKHVPFGLTVMIIGYNVDIGMIFDYGMNIFGHDRINSTCFFE